MRRLDIVVASPKAPVMIDDDDDGGGLRRASLRTNAFAGRTALLTKGD